MLDGTGLDCGTLSVRVATAAAGFSTGLAAWRTAFDGLLSRTTAGVPTARVGSLVVPRAGGSLLAAAGSAGAASGGPAVVGTAPADPVVGAGIGLATVGGAVVVSGGDEGASATLSRV